MSKNLTIKITSEGTTGRVDIIGSIAEWNQNNAVDFRNRCQEIKDSGVTSCLVYLMTVGGDCFQANEIVNILIEIFGSYDAEGGAIVASAGTYIVVNAKTSKLAKNGQFMIHKPSGGAFGNEQDVENYLQLLKNMTVTYYDAYLAKLKKTESEFKAKWDGGDFWMTAQEAKDWGFVTEIKDSVKIDKATAQAIQSCGSPIAIQIDKYEDSMDSKIMAKALGLPDNSTDEQISAKLADNARKASEYDTLKAQVEQKEKEEKAAKIKDELDKAVKEKRISADVRPNWQSQFEKDFEGTKALLDNVQKVTKLSAEIVVTSDGTGSKYQGKTFEQLQDESPELLAELEDENPEAYTALFADWKKRNKIK